jgi:hypothetical protein
MYPDCGKDFSRKFICDNFNQSFVTGELKKHREDIYFEQEKALLPATQARVVEIIRAEERQDARDIMRSRLRVMGLKYHEEKSKVSSRKNSMKAKDYQEIQHILITQYRTDERNVYDAFHSLHGPRSNIDPEAGKHRFIRPCSDTGCKGFLSTAWKCGLCDKHACSQCHVVLVGDKKEHVCDPDTLATAKLIVSQSKPCPGCHINISKIDGCNQMWCTICNTAWDWKSGRIETKVHNPHYFEYMRNRGTAAVVQRNPNEVLCGRELDHHFIREINVFLAQIPLRPGYTQSESGRIITGVRHLETFHINDVGASPNALDLRVKFMRNQIDEKQFKRSVQMLYKKFYKEKEIEEVLVMFRQMVTDISYRYLDDLRACTDPTKLGEVPTMNEVGPLLEYVNDSLKTISKTYQSVVLVVSLDPYNRATYGLKNAKCKT